MIGVVVWTDQTFEKAVIWCEDQSDLAYFVRPDESDFDSLNTQETAGVCTGETTATADISAIRKGDLVIFDPYYEGDCRMARNLRLLEEDSHPMLAEYLRPEETGSQDTASSQSPADPGHTATVAVDAKSDQVGETGTIVPFLGASGGAARGSGRAGRRKSG